MTKTFKKIAASVMAAATLALGSVGMTASAQTESDGYSTFTWNSSGSSISASLTNTSGASRYAQLSIYGYNQNGAYVDHVGNGGIISNRQTLSVSGIITAYRYAIYAYLYSSTVPRGTPLSSWVRTIG